MGTRRQKWMPFRPPFLTAGERFVKNTSNIELNLLHAWFIDLCKTPWQHPWPTPSEEVTSVGLGGSIDPMPKEGQTAPPWWWCLWIVVLVVDGTFCTIPILEILQERSVLFQPEPYGG